VAGLAWARAWVKETGRRSGMVEERTKGL